MSKKLLHRLSGVAALHKENTRTPWLTRSQSHPERMTVSHEAFRKYLSKDLKLGDTLKIRVRPPGSEVPGGVDRGPLNASYQVQQQPGADGGLVGILDVTKVRNYMNSAARYYAEVLENDVVEVWPTEQQDYFVLGLVKETCYLCGKETGIEANGTAYFCDSCNKGVHAACTGVVRKLRKDEDFLCPKCRPAAAQESSEEKGANSDVLSGDEMEAEVEVESAGEEKEEEEEEEEAGGRMEAEAVDVGTKVAEGIEPELDKETEKVGRNEEEDAERNGEGEENGSDAEPSLGTDEGRQGEEEDEREEAVAQAAVAEDDGKVAEGKDYKEHDMAGEEEEEVDAGKQSEKEDKRKKSKRKEKKVEIGFNEEIVGQDKGEEKRTIKKSGKRKAKEGGKQAFEASPVAKAAASKEQPEEEEAVKEGRKQKDKAKAADGEDAAENVVAEDKEAMAKDAAKERKQKGKKEGKRKREEEVKEEDEDVKAAATQKDAKKGESKDIPEVEGTSKRQKKERKSKGGKDEIEEVQQPKPKVELPSSRGLRSRPDASAEAQPKAKRARKAGKEDVK